MTEPVRGNAAILADRKAFQETYARAQEFFKKFDGVAGVGFGLKETGGKFSDDIAIVVYVYEKKDAADIPPEQRIPPVFEGYRTDVSIVQPVQDTACDNTAVSPSVQGGIQIGVKDSVGTLGCIVRKRNDAGRENVYLLTNKHVLYGETHGAGDDVYQAFHPDHPDHTGDSYALGPIQPGAVRRNVNMIGPDFATNQPMLIDYYVDAAVARVNIDCTCCGSDCTKNKIKYDAVIAELGVNGGKIADVRDVRGDAGIIYIEANKTVVYKVGRTTRRTVGRVVRINAQGSVSRDKSIPNSQGFTAFNFIQVILDDDLNENGLNCQGHLLFTEEGDSGSLLVDEDGKAIGLCFGGTILDNRTNACHIVPVLDALNVSIVSDGTAHGSTSATDGSGVALSVNEADPALMPAGQIVFTRETAEDEQHMRTLLAELRTTRRGRELHELFGRVRREVGYLVRNHKLVKVAWHRHKGPAFLTHVLNHLRGHSETVPREIEGVSATTLLLRMAEVLRRYGSNTLRAAIDTHYDEGLRLLHDESVVSVTDVLERLRKEEDAA